MNITANTIFIPGATSGIGLALATRLQAKGNTVIIGGRRGHRLDELRAEHGLQTVQIDTADPESIRRVCAELVATYPDLNSLIAMAGIMRPEDWTGGDFLETSEAIVTTNLLGPIRLIAALIDQLRAQPSASILTVSSGLAWIPLAPTPTYNATKAAIHMLSESIRLQLAGTGVEVLEIAPPAVQTALMPGQEAADYAMPLEAYADEVVALLESERDSDEILVENVKFMRYAASEGRYDDVVAAVNSLAV